MTDEEKARAFDFDHSGPFGNEKRIERLIAAFAAVREECAKVADVYADKWWSLYKTGNTEHRASDLAQGKSIAGEAIAKAIRTGPSRPSEGG